MNSREKFRLYFVLELVLWLFVIIIGVSAFRYHSMKKQNAYKIYQIFMQDVDGLIVGSPVRMMGIPIGYINTIKIVGDHIYVKFVITQKDFQLPKGVIATVEFNGMGGSKSLELYPPNEVSKALGDLISIKQTNRLGAALGLLNDMFEKLESIIVRCSIFSDGIAQIMPSNGVVLKDPAADVSNTVNQAGNIIEKLDTQRMDLKEKMKGLTYEQ